jgi:hypothetical protein
MPFFLARGSLSDVGRPELAKSVFKTRLEAVEALRPLRGRWMVIGAPTWVDAARMAKERSAR